MYFPELIILANLVDLQVTRPHGERLIVLNRNLVSGA